MGVAMRLPLFFIIKKKKKKNLIENNNSTPTPEKLSLFSQNIPIKKGVKSFLKSVLSFVFCFYEKYLCFESELFVICFKKSVLLILKRKKTF
jgi:hypothetical protein